MKKRLIESTVTAQLRALKKVNKKDELPLALFIFRRDLRLFDNTALLACAKSYKVAPIFIFTPEQLLKNPFKSSNAVEFMVESLEDLKGQIESEGGKFFTFFGEVEEVLTRLIRENEVKAVYFNRDYTPYAVARDAKIAELCIKSGVACESFDDALLMEDLSLRTGTGSVYTVFTPFGNRLAALPKRKVNFESVENWGELAGPKPLDDFRARLLEQEVFTENPNLAVRGGRAVGVGLLNRACKELSNYAKSRDVLGKSGTTQLSAHNKFGTLSIREIYFALAGAFGAQHDLIKQLYWRDFYYYLAAHKPEVLDGVPIPSKLRYSEINWRNDPKEFDRWCRGETGFPVVDAGIRQLNSTGFMHNRARMIVAMFLTKDLQIDWRWGEKHFAQKLVDYDRAQNAGGWAWCAGTGTDGSPFLRIFNPWLQQQKFDPDCVYIKRWVKELAGVSPADIHNWPEACSKYPGTYFCPMVDHSQAKIKALEAYGESKGGKKPYKDSDE